MELIIKQSMLQANFQYKIYEKDNLIYTASVNRALLPSLRKIFVRDINGKEICSLKQEDILKLILKQLPFISFFKFSVCPFIYYENNERAGYIRENVNGDGYVYGYIGEEYYEIWEHSGTNISIIRDLKQVAAIKKSSMKVFDGDEYRVIFNKGCDKHLVVILCLLSDVLWFTSDNSSSSLSWEYNVQLTGRKIDRNWNPED